MIELLQLAAGLIGLILLGVAANRWGVDSRDTMDPARPHAAPW